MVQLLSVVRIMIPAQPHSFRLIGTRMSSSFSFVSLYLHCQYKRTGAQRTIGTSTLLVSGRLCVRYQVSVRFVIMWQTLHWPDRPMYQGTCQRTCGRPKKCAVRALGFAKPDCSDHEANFYSVINTQKNRQAWTEIIDAIKSPQRRLRSQKNKSYFCAPQRGVIFVGRTVKK